MQRYSNDQIEKATALRTNFRYFSRTAICIKGKKPGEVFWGLGCEERPDGAPCWEWNKAQDALDAAINKMLAELGWVRLIIVKGRQQGVSTYLEMRLFWKAMTVPETQVCIISHEADSSIALFRKAQFARQHLPSALQFEPKASNRKELILPNGSAYLVLTAGSEESGRSQTAHHQHQSERAFFPNADAIDMGAGQIVADVEGTEVYKESTGNGMNHFYREVLDALAGKGKFRVIFLPWYWQDEYRTRPAHNFKREKDEELLVELYGLDDWQLQWRRDKIVEFKGDLKRFRQEYPNTLMEAFQQSGDAFFNADHVAKARQSTLTSTYGPIVIGVDPGREGDRTVITVRRGRQVIEIIKYEVMQSMRLAGIVGNLIDRYKATKVFIDWGMGHGTIDRLHERGYRQIVEGVNFGGSPDDEVYLNKRAEMAYRFREWLAEGEVRLPDDDDMQADIASMPDSDTTSSGRIKFPSKEDIKKVFGRSPDILDAIMLTFAYNVRDPNEQGDDNMTQRTRNTRKGSQSTILSRVRQTPYNDQDAYRRRPYRDRGAVDWVVIPFVLAGVALGSVLGPLTGGIAGYHAWKDHKEAKQQLEDAKKQADEAVRRLNEATPKTGDTI